VGSCCGDWFINTTKKKYRVWCPSEDSLFALPSEVTTLDALLSQSESIEKPDRLLIGFKLALSVLQLHTTDWLSESWGKKDILFMKQKDEGSGSWTPVITKPFVSCVFSSRFPPSQSRAGSQKNPHPNPLFNYNKSLFSLGILLVELWYGKCLEDLRQKDDCQADQELTDLTTMRRLIDQLYNDAGAKYRNAVRHCAGDWSQPHLSLDKDALKNEVHHLVVEPLMENLEAFWGSKLSDIL